MSESIQNFEAMQGAFLQNQTESVIVLSEELPQGGGGIDYSKHFWEPQVGKSYTIKFLTNPFGEPLTHRKIYKNLPDPKRKGKKFQVVSSGSAKTCQVLELFFELNNLKKENDPIATMKLKNYMGVTNQACALIQVLSSPDPAEIGIFRIFQLASTAKSDIANLINKKLNPTKQAIENGEEKEDIFNVFNSSVLMIECEEADFEGVKGRDYAKSDWAKKQRGAFIDLEDENGNVTERYQFTAEDVVDGKVREQALPAFRALIGKLTHPDLSIHNYFAYKTIGDSKNTEDTEKYLVQLEEKVKEIIPVIRNAKSIAEITNYGVAEQPKDSATMIGGAKASDILKDSAPSELASSILNDAPEPNAETPAPVSVPAPVGNQTVNDILNA